MRTKSLFLLLIALSFLGGVCAQQRVLNIDSCRALALAQNHDLQMGVLRVEKAKNEHKAAFTNFLPKITGRAAYFYNGKNMQLLSKEQQDRLAHLGDRMTEKMKGNDALSEALFQLAMKNPTLIPTLTALQAQLPILANDLNALGTSIVNDLNFDMQSVTLGAVTLTQPIFMGGKICAYNRATKLAEDLSRSQAETSRNDVIVSTDKAYWQVVSLVNKQKLAANYFDLLQKLQSDIEKMVNEGVATKSDLLTVRVKVNEAEMSLAKVEDGLNLSRMLLCQLCGLPLDTDMRLADEGLEDFHPHLYEGGTSIDSAYAQRPELRSLNLGVQIYQEKMKIARAAYFPQIALVGNFLVTNPSLYNGFEKKFNWNWNVGITLSIPIWDWQETTYKTRAAQAEYREYQEKLADVKEKIEMQVTQAVAGVREANKRLAMAERNLERAEENLRYANLGFQEGVITVSKVLEAQTAWMSARSTRLDAKIDVQLSDLNLRKVLGVSF